MATKSPVPIAEEVSSIIVKGHLMNPRYVEISPAGRIQSQKRQGKDVIPTRSLVDRRMSDRGCR